MTDTSTPPPGEKRLGIWQTLRAAYAEGKRRANHIEMRRAEQIDLWFNTKREVREAKSRLRDAVDRCFPEELIGTLRRQVEIWTEMYEDADSGLKFINGERDRQHSDRRARFTTWMAGIGLLLSIFNVVKGCA